MQDGQILILLQVHSHNFSAGVGEIPKEFIDLGGKKYQILNPDPNLKVFLGFKTQALQQIFKYVSSALDVSDSSYFYIH